jgi:hypothetical protein
MAELDANNPYYGRKWQIIYTPSNGSSSMVMSSSDFGDYALRATFKRDLPGYQAIAYCDVTVWNINAETANLIAASKTGTLSLQAGYVNGAYGTIFNGGVFQIIQGRVDVTDYYVTFHCIDGHGVLNNNLVSFSVQNPVNQRTICNNIATQATTPFELTSVTSNLNDQPLPRGKVVFGEPKKYLRSIAQDNNAQFFAMNTASVTISKLTDSPSGKVVILSPSTGLIGYPKQINWGVQCDCLLNPNITVAQPAMQVQLQQTVIQQQLIQYGQLQMPLDANGIYKIARVTHTGDTRGNDWQTQFTGVLDMVNLPAMLQSAGQGPN